MRSVNKVILIGHLTRDPELRQTANGQPVATFSIATNRMWTDSSGQKQEATEYHDLVAVAQGKPVRFRKPVIYQEVAGRRREIAGAYALRGERNPIWEPTRRV